MNLEQKQAAVAEMGELFASSQAAFLVEYQGCSCDELNGVRKQLLEQGAKFQVVKNKLLRRVVNENEASAGLSERLTGPTAVIWAKESIVEPAKIITDFAKDKESFEVKGGFVDGAVVEQQGVEALAKMPSKKELQAKLLSLINAPAVKLLQTVNAPSAQLVRLLGAWRDELEKKEGGDS